MKARILKAVTLSLTTLVTMAIAQPGQAQVASEKVMSTQVVTLPVDISTTKLKLSNAGYASFVVKVLIPELASVTLLDHRNEGEEAPCMATFDVMDPAKVIQGNPRVENHQFTIELRKQLFADRARGVCKVSLQEDISANIRGFLFVHSRTAPLPDRVLADCQ